MPSWLQSLDAVLRTMTLLSWMGISFAVLAAASGAAALYLGRHANDLRQQQLQKEMAATSRSEETHKVQLQELQQRLDDAQELLVSSEVRSEGFLDRIESLEQQLARLQAQAARRAAPPPRPTSPRPERSTPAANRATPAGEDRQEAPAPTPGLLSAERLEALRGALVGKPPGEITLVTVFGQPTSVQLAGELRAILVQAGWKVETIQGVFPRIPQQSSFVVHSRDSLPPTMSTLSAALASVDLVSSPINVITNPDRPPGYLGLIVAPLSPGS